METHVSRRRYMRRVDSAGDGEDLGGTAGGEGPADREKQQRRIRGEV